MRDWEAFVRARLALPGLTPERESRIVRELAAQLEDFAREALDGGATEAEADAHAARQVADWERLARDVSLADRRHARPPLERLADRFDTGGAGLLPGRRRRGPMIADLLRDVRQAARHLAKAPGFTLAAVLTLALGIGATSAIFSVVNGVVLRPLPYPDPGSLVRVWEIVPQYGRFAVAPASFLDWRRSVTAFDGLAAYSGRDMTLEGVEEPQRLVGMAASWELFDVLRVQPLMGRTFAPADDVAGGGDVVVLSHGMWQRRLGADPRVIGRSLTLNGRARTVIGVMPPGFYYPTREVELWQPIALDPAKATRGGHYLSVVGRLKAATSVARAEAEMKAIAERLALQYPDTSANESAEVLLLHEQVVGRIRPALFTLLAAVGVTVLIACANVANLLLVRASVRRKEMAIRGALGAGRVRLVAQMLMESVVLGLAGGALGLVLTWLVIRPIRTLGAGSIPRAADIAIDARVLGFALAVSLLTSLVFGLVPAWQAARAGVTDVLKEGGRGSWTGGGRWIRTSLLVGEVALSMVLLVGAALLLRSFAKVTGVDPGFSAEHVLAFRVSLPQLKYSEDHQIWGFYDSLVRGLESSPQVRSAGLVQALPLRGDYMLSFSIQGRPAAKPDEGPSANYRVVSPHYFESLSIPLLRGRGFAAGDADKAPLVAIVDEAFARRYFPDEDPVGRAIDIGNGTDGFVQIVGLVGSVRHDGLDATPSPTMYVPFTQDAFRSVWVVLRTDGDPAAQPAAVRRIVRGLDPSLAAYDIAPLIDIVSESVAERRFTMLLLAAFAAIALSLAAVGLYGVVAYGVSQRTQEIGIRMAIGAGRGDVLRLIVGGGLRLALVGVGVGLAGALALSGVLRTMLFGVTSSDPASYAGTAVMLVAIASLACYIPARRATRLDPVLALRQE